MDSFTTSVEMTRKHKSRNLKTIPIVKITLTGLSGTICSIPNIEGRTS